MDWAAVFVSCGSSVIPAAACVAVAVASAAAPVGVFGSGVGGLSVLGEIRARLPNESLLYVADSGHVPYGEKSAEYILQRCCRITDFLLARGIKALVLACKIGRASCRERGEISVGA